MPGVVHDGTSLVTLNLAACLAEKFEIDLVTQRLTGREDSAARAVCPPFSNVTIIEPDNAGHWLKRAAYRIKYELASVVTAVPRAVFYSTGPNVRACLRQMFAKERYAAAVFEYYTTAPLLALANCPTALVLIDATYKTLEYQSVDMWGPRRWLARWKIATMRRYEATLAERADACFALSKRDIELLQAAGSRIDIKYLPVLFPPPDRESLAQMGQSTLGDSKIAFLGNLRYEENRQAFQWFARCVMPYIRDQMPEATVCVFGGGEEALPPDLRRLPGFHFTGWVEDLGTALRSCTCGVAPSISGTGVKIKVLEMMWHGLPLVATSIAAAGTPAAYGAAFVEDEPEKFAQGVVRLIRDDGLRETLARAALQELERTHCSDNVRQRIQQQFLSLALKEIP